MNIKRIKTISLHSWYHLTHSVETWIDLFWFSLINIIVFGLITSYFIKGGNSQDAQIILLGNVLWPIIIVGQYSITVGALWEIWSRSFSNLFITPLTMTEFVAGHMLGSVYKSLIVFLFTALISAVLYNFYIFDLGLVLIILYLELLIFSWSSGLFILALILRFGTNIQSLAWGLVFIVQPLAAVFYPVSILPGPVRYVSYIFPVTYVFEAARMKYSAGIIQWTYLFYATAINVIFLTLSYLFLNKMHLRGKKTGAFARMEN